MYVYTYINKRYAIYKIYIHTILYLILIARAGNKERQHLAKVKVASQIFAIAAL